VYETTILDEWEARGGVLGHAHTTTPQHERFYRAISEPAQSRTLPPEEPLDMEKIEAAAREYKVEILGPPPGAQV
jgi:hypothetical protein